MEAMEADKSNWELERRKMRELVSLRHYNIKSEFFGLTSNVKSTVFLVQKSDSDVNSIQKHLKDICSFI